MCDMKEKLKYTSYYLNRKSFEIKLFIGRNYKFKYRCYVEFMKVYIDTKNKKVKH